MPVQPEDPWGQLGAAFAANRAPNAQANLQPAPQLQPLTPEEKASLLDTIGSSALHGLGYIGGSLGKAFGGRAIRGALGGRPDELLSIIPFSDTLGITDPGREVRGSDLLGGNAETPFLSPQGLGGFALDMALDPATWFGGAIIKGIGKGASLAAKGAVSIPKVGPILGEVGSAAKNLYQRTIPPLFEKAVRGVPEPVLQPFARQITAAEPAAAAATRESVIPLLEKTYEMIGWKGGLGAPLPAAMEQEANTIWQELRMLREGTLPGTPRPGLLDLDKMYEGLAQANKAEAEALGYMKPQKPEPPPPAAPLGPQTVTPPSPPAGSLPAASPPAPLTSPSPPTAVVRPPEMVFPGNLYGTTAYGMAAPAETFATAAAAGPRPISLVPQGMEGAFGAIPMAPKPAGPLAIGDIIARKMAQMSEAGATPAEAQAAKLLAGKAPETVLSAKQADKLKSILEIGPARKFPANPTVADFWDEIARQAQDLEFANNPIPAVIQEAIGSAKLARNEQMALEGVMSGSSLRALRSLGVIVHEPGAAARLVGQPVSHETINQLAKTAFQKLIDAAPDKVGVWPTLEDFLTGQAREMASALEGQVAQHLAPGQAATIAAQAEKAASEAVNSMLARIDELGAQGAQNAAAEFGTAAEQAARAGLTPAELEGVRSSVSQATADELLAIRQGRAAGALPEAGAAAAGKSTSILERMRAKQAPVATALALPVEPIAPSTPASTMPTPATAAPIVPSAIPDKFPPEVRAARDRLVPVLESQAKLRNALEDLQLRQAQGESGLGDQISATAKSLRKLDKERKLAENLLADAEEATGYVEKPTTSWVEKVIAPAASTPSAAAMPTPATALPIAPVSPGTQMPGFMRQGIQPVAPVPAAPILPTPATVAPMRYVARQAGEPIKEASLSPNLGTTPLNKLSPGRSPRIVEPFKSPVKLPVDGPQGINALFSDAVGGKLAQLPDDVAASTIAKTHLGVDQAAMDAAAATRAAVDAGNAVPKEALAAMEHTEDVMEQARRLADMNKVLDHKAIDAMGGYFPNSPLADMIDKLVRDSTKFIQARTVQKSIATVAKPIAELGRDAVPLTQVLADAGLGGQHILENGAKVPYANAAAMERVLDELESLGKIGPATKDATRFQQAAGLAVPGELAPYISKFIDSGTAPAGAMKAIQVLNSWTNLVKAWQTVTWPAHVLRNQLTAAFRNWTVGAFDPHENPVLAYVSPWIKARQWRNGETIANLGKLIPDFKGLSDAEAMAKLNGEIWSWNIQKHVGKQTYDLLGYAPKEGIKSIPFLGAPKKPIPDILGGAIPKTLAEANPLNVAGFGGLTEDVNSLVKSGRSLDTALDDINRVSVYIAKRMQGNAPLDAFKSTIAAHYDFSNLSSFERNVMRTVAPFYSWSRQNLPAIIGEVINNPGGKTAQTIRLFTRMTAEQPGFVPQYVGSGAQIPIGGENAQGRRTFLGSLGTPVEDVADILKPSGMLGLLNPVIKAPLELMTGKNFFTGRDLTGTASPTGVALSAGQQILNATPLSRFATTGRMLANPNIGWPEAVANLAGPGRLTNVDVENARQGAIRNYAEQQLLMNPLVRQFHRVYVPKEMMPQLTPQEMLMLRLLNEQQRARQHGQPF